MVHADSPPHGGSSSGLVGVLIAFGLAVLSLYVRFRSVPRLLQRQAGKGSLRVLANLTGSRFLAFCMLAGAYGVSRSSGDVMHGFLVGIISLAVLFVEMPRLRDPRVRSDTYNA